MIRIKQLLKIQPFFSLQTKESGRKVHLFPLVRLLKPGVEQALPMLREHRQTLCFGGGSSVPYESGVVHEVCGVW